MPEIDFIARAPRSSEVEELTQKQIIKALRNKVPVDQYVEMYGLTNIVMPKDTLETPPKGEPKGGRREGRNDKGKEQTRERKAPSPPRPEPIRDEPKIELTDDQKLYVGILEKLSGRLKANIIDPKGAVIQELDVKDLTSTLKGYRKKIKAIVFDGVITQRLLDIAVEKNVQDIVGKKMGNVSNVPKTLNIWTLDDLSPR